MKISDLDQPRIGDIVEFETDPETVVEGVIVGETEDGYIYEFSESGYTELHEACTYGKYYCSTDKMYKCRRGPKQSRTTEAANAAQQAAIAIAKKKKKHIEEARRANTASARAELGKRDKKVDPVQQDKKKQEEDEAWERLQQHMNKKKGVAEGSDNITAVFSGYGNYMKGRGANVFKHYGITVLDQQYDEDEDIAEYTVSGSKEALDQARAYLERSDQFGGMILQQGVEEEKQRLDPKCWDGYKKDGTKMKGGVRVNNCVKEASGYIPRNSQEAQDPRWSSALTGDVTTSTMREQIGKFFPTTAPKDGQEQITEAEYQGREVPLGRPMRGDVKKFKVYVKDPSTGNVKKVNFGDPNMRIKKSNPARRKSFRARHNCANPGPRTKARYWSCRKW